MEDHRVHGIHLSYDIDSRSKEMRGPHLSSDVERRTERLGITRRWFEILFHIVRVELGDDVVRKEPVARLDFYRDVLLILWGRVEYKNAYHRFAEVACNAVGILYCLSFTPDDKHDRL